MNKAFLFCVFLLVSTFCVVGQYKQPKMSRTVSFELNQLMPNDTAFVHLLDSTLLHSDRFIRGNFSKKKQNYFCLGIDTQDSITYNLSIELWPYPCKTKQGCIEKGKSIYIFQGDVFPLFTQSKKKKLFKYIEYTMTYDPPTWEIKYDSQKKTIELIQD